MDKVKIAVTHASGLLAEALLERMAKMGIKSDNVVLLDQENQVGNRLSYGDTYLMVADQHEYDYEDLTAVLLLEPDAELESLLQHADCYVVSHHVDKINNSIFTPQLSPQSNLPQQPCAIKLASAELATLLLVSKAIHENYEIKELNAVNVLSSSIYGKSGVEELASQTISLLNSQQVETRLFPLQLAFNMIPVESTADMEQQLVSGMQAKELKCSIQNILIPAFHGLAISISLETRQKIDMKKLTEIFSETPSRPS